MLDTIIFAVKLHPESYSLIYVQTAPVPANLYLTVETFLLDNFNWLDELDCCIGDNLTVLRTVTQVAPDGQLVITVTENTKGEYRYSLDYSMPSTELYVHQATPDIAMLTKTITELLV